MPSLRDRVREIVDKTPVLDFHTHLYPPSFGMTLWGADEILTYHYLVAEVMRFAPITPAQFFAMEKPAQADLIWDTLFVRNSPISEATTGVCTIFSAFGLDPRAKDLREARAFFSAQPTADHFTRVMRLGGIEALVMTNDPFDERESPHWETGSARDPRFHAALRLDPLLNAWPDASQKLRERGYACDQLDHATIWEIRRFLEDWIVRMNPLYAAVSLPPSFAYPQDSARITVLKEAVLPVCREHNLPFAMMIGVRKQVNPALGDAGDSVGIGDVGVVERLCHDFPDNRFLVTMLARENQQALCVAARKFANLLPFGCWWFMNNPSLVAETTQMRLEMLGPSFVPQHSDARVLEHLIYKWRHSRREIAGALANRYEALASTGWSPTDAEIERDSRLLLHDNAATWLGLA
jgi:hypothetical protein